MSCALAVLTSIETGRRCRVECGWPRRPCVSAYPGKLTITGFSQRASVV